MKNRLKKIKEIINDALTTPIAIDKLIEEEFVCSRAEGRRVVFNLTSKDKK